MQGRDERKRDCTRAAPQGISRCQDFASLATCVGRRAEVRRVGISKHLRSRSHERLLEDLPANLRIVTSVREVPY